MIRRPPRSTLSSSSAASDVYKRQAGVTRRWHFSTGAAACDWGGVRCDDRKQVTGLDLSCARGEHPQAGTLPSALGDLTALKSFRADGCGLSGTIPLALLRLTALQELVLGHNKLSGSLSPALADLQALRELRLGGCRLTGSIPEALGGMKALEQVWLGKNSLSGTLPAAMRGLTSMRVLSLERNMLSGSISSALVSSWGRLGTLQAAQNRFTGLLPGVLCESSPSALVSCNLEGSLFECPLPRCAGSGIGATPRRPCGVDAVSYTHLRAHETVLDLVCRLLLEKKKTSPKM
eukprot:TRINITY_DN11850_c0_g2_i1.p1 TRINITY_DN11850_c0_g2~~TRINITY_DN11850_c0_g2_i1.p1  ORF type:complete len:292 (-),score=49.72 TRINITY_DN11850_c0_g2_i1:3-878(-)